LPLFRFSLIRRLFFDERQLLFDYASLIAAIADVDAVFISYFSIIFAIAAADYFRHATLPPMPAAMPFSPPLLPILAFRFISMLFSPCDGG
jgi:hypothetical protein